MVPACSNRTLVSACLPVGVSNLSPFKSVFIPSARRLAISLITLIVLQTAGIGQTGTSLATAEKTVRSPGLVLLETLTPPRLTSAVADPSDSLVARRTFFSTTVSQQGKRVGKRSIIELMEDIPQAQTLYLRGQLLKPAGPLLIASSLVVGYVAIKGTQKMAYARGIGTPANPAPPDELVEYTSRSLPALIGSMGLLVGGLCLIEVANGITAKSIKLYNTQVNPRRSVSTLQTLNLAITTSGNLGLEASF